ncbi:3-deoxy-D-manno-octulosonic-acid transferase [Roseovarius sp. MBR-78]|jgi:3-deoxy-D-manno-octulosonic-acid transferase
MPGPGVPLTLRLYGAAADLLGPVIWRGMRRKLEAQGTDPARWPERLGHATQPRPEGRLIWFHAASMGEAASVLPLIAHWGTVQPDTEFLITSGTATSAAMLARRLPKRCRHQFAPLDTRPALGRFLRHWRPDAGIFVESELWPQMLRQTARAGVPLALVNARLSDRSARGWARAGRTARHLMGHFRLIHCQDARTEANLRALGLDLARQGPNLKALSGALPVDQGARAALEGLIGARPVWLAASTHPGEDEIMLDAHSRLLAHLPEALLILAPRHPERGAALEGLIAARGLHGARRSIGAQPSAQTQVYLADTLGEMGLWYALCPLTCICGSFTPVGGHTPYEPAHAGAAILHGPHYANFAEVYPALDACGAGREVADGADLAAALSHLLQDARTRDAMREAARGFAAGDAGALAALTDDLITALGLAR